ncbi:LysR family transcriptional regulator [Thermanaerosceptrum fracticalcis]|uniref:LysR family transcriptional regulator n=2 Tax=Thermanaerosceptrum fracticalcis TaxID=1712410 RepID=A0A7G6E7J8_THEFR|nr:LysR family transcriptional regulator [Thermanaerosceptrum fracticalcis]
MGAFSFLSRLCDNKNRPPVSHVQKKFVLENCVAYNGAKVGEVMIGMKHLQAFVTVVREKSFSRAAEVLYQTQPALSKQVKALENYLGAVLLDRSEKEVTLTDAGALFYPEAKRILDTLTQAKGAIAELQGLKRGKLSLGASTLPGEYLLPALVGKFRKIYPGIDVEIKVADTREIINALKSGEVQIGFLGAPPVEPIFEAYPFSEDRIILIAPPHYPDRVTDLSWDQLILREKGSGTRQVVEEFFKQQGRSVEKTAGAMEIGSTRAIINAVAAGWGFSFVSHWAAEEALLLGKVKEIPYVAQGIQRLIYCARVLNHYHGCTAQAFWEFAKDNSQK